MNDYGLVKFMFGKRGTSNEELKKIVKERTVEDCERQVRVIFARLGITKRVVFEKGRPRLE